MQIPKEVIKRAVAGGWQNQSNTPISLVTGHTEQWERVALDPTFWQALGKALGWEKLETNSAEWFEWSENAHRFYDLNLQGQDTTAFWESLLANK